MSLDDWALQRSRRAADNRRYRLKHGHPCALCGRLCREGATHCERCSRVLRQSRYMADCLGAERRRELAHAAALALQRDGYVAVRLVSGTPVDFWQDAPDDQIEPDSWDPNEPSIPFPEELPEPAVKVRGCTRCDRVTECRQTGRLGMPSLCERTACVSVGGVMMEL